MTEPCNQKPGSARQICVYGTKGVYIPAVAAVAAALAGIVGCATAGSSGSPLASTSISASSSSAVPAGASGRPAPAATSTSPVPAPTVPSPSAFAGSASAQPAKTATAPAASTTPAPGRSTLQKTLLTQADSGLTIRLPVGAEVTVVLSSGSQGTMWDRPAASDGAVVRVSVSGGYPSHLPAQAVFRAVAPGTSQLTSQSDLPCFHQTPRCMVATQVWHVTVVVPAVTAIPSSSNT
jgi:hypothetical protein